MQDRGHVGGGLQRENRKRTQAKERESERVRARVRERESERDHGVLMMVECHKTDGRRGCEMCLRDLVISESTG